MYGRTDKQTYRQKISFKNKGRMGSVRVRPSVYPQAKLVLNVSQLGLRVSQSGLSASLPGPRANQPNLRDKLLGLRASQPDLRTNQPEGQPARYQGYSA